MSQQDDAPVDWAEVPVSTLAVDGRVSQCFKRNGIKTVADVISMEEKELTDMRGFGPNCLRMVKEALAEYGLSLKPADYLARR